MARPKVNRIVDGKKPCSRCGIIKPLVEFSKDQYSPDKLKWYCRACQSSRFKAWRQSNLEAIRKQDRITYYIRKYHFSQDVAEALVENRTGICEICKHEDLLVVDHNHASGKLRGFICSSCNSALGYAKEDKQILEHLIKYLDKYEK